MSIFTKEFLDECPSIILRTKGSGANQDGGFVAEFKSLPPAMMLNPPEIMMWGQRFFIFKHERNDGAMIYVESMCWPLIVGSTCEEVK